MIHATGHADIIEKPAAVDSEPSMPFTPRFTYRYLSAYFNAIRAEEALSVKDALRMCTYNGYLATFDEKDRGSLETGKIADMAILSENPYTVPKERLGEIKVTELLLGGKTYESAVSPIFTHIMRGIKNKGNC